MTIRRRAGSLGHTILPSAWSGPQRLWVDPDCDLKTCNCAETEASLRHLAQAVREVRAEAVGPAGPAVSRLSTGRPPVPP